MDHAQTPPPTPPTPYIGAGAQLPNVDPHQHALMQLNFTPPQVPMAIHVEQWVPDPDDVLDLLDAGEFPQQGVFDMNMQPLQLPQPPFGFQQLNPLVFEEDLNEEPWVPGEDDVLDLEAAEPHPLFAQLHMDPDEEVEEEEFDEGPWVPGPEDVLDLEDDGPQPPLAPPHLNPVIEMIEAARAALAAEPIPEIGDMDAPQGSPENEAGPLPIANINLVGEGVVGVPVYDGQMHHSQDELSPAVDGHAADIAGAPSIQPEPLAAEATNAPQNNRSGPVQQVPHVQAPPHRSAFAIGFQLPEPILEEMAALASVLPPMRDPEDQRDLLRLLMHARLQFVANMIEHTVHHEQLPQRSDNSIRAGFKAVARSVNNATTKTAKNAWGSVRLVSRTLDGVVRRRFHKEGNNGVIGDITVQVQV
ncbi:hypothetical protein PENSPDRAFT_473427 [Peniophora sp. CONT]|nr:hypothetical protein PENSPDRAFT_473427 [Peniophora sp. CONT]